MATDVETDLGLRALSRVPWHFRDENEVHCSEPRDPVHVDSLRPPLREVGGKPVIGSVAWANDNAVCENFFTTLKCELLNRRRFSTRGQMIIFDFIEGFYTPRRRNFAIGQKSVVTFENGRLPVA